MKQVTASFWLRVSKNELSPIYCKIYYDDDRADFPTGIRIPAAKWKDGVVAGRGEADIHNSQLESIRYKIMTIANRLYGSEEFITAAMVKDVFLGKDRREHTLVECFEITIKEKIALGVAVSTMKQYDVLLNSIKAFLKDTYKVLDVTLQSMVTSSRREYHIASDYQIWAKTKNKPLSASTLNKNLFITHSILLNAVKKGWTNRSAFADAKVPVKKSEHTYLTDEEVETIESLKLSNPKHIMARDIFLFCCYSGLAWIDASQVTASHVSLGIENIDWIFIGRQKTMNSSAKECKIPLDERAQEIINKYKKYSGLTEPLFGNISYSNYLLWLSRIQTDAKLDKHLTTHVARHTFAVRMLNKGYSFDAVAEMLGHADTTMVRKIYGEITPKRIAMEFQRIASGKPLLASNQN